MKSRIFRLVLVIVCVLILAFLLVNSCAKQETPNHDPAPITDDPINTVPSDDAETPTPAPDNTDEQTADSTPAPTQDPDPTPTPEPTPDVLPVGSVVPAADPVEDEWFSDAAFLGNSLVDGFRLFSGLTSCDYYCATSMTVAGAGGLINQMAAKQYSKVYILLGINEIGFDADYFKGQYASMLDTIMEQQPDADIYIMGLSPVSEYKSTTDKTFTMDRVRLYNEKLKELAEEKGCYYIDLVEALSDETGYLPASVTTDGVHFAASHYLVWLDYLRTHHA